MLPRIAPLIISPILLLAAMHARAEALSFARTESLWRENNFELKLAQHAIRGATGDLAAADRRENPTFSLSSSYLSPRAGLGAGGLRDKNADSVIRIEQLLERGDKRALRAKSAEAKLEASRLDADEAERAGLIQLSGAYWDLKAAAARRQLADSTAQLAREATAAAEKRLSVGDISAADVAKLRVDALRVENDARQAAVDLQRAQLTLALLIGRASRAETIECADDWPAMPASNAIPPVQDTLVERRSDVRAATQRLAAAEAALAGSRALAKRDITVGVQFEHYPTVGELPPNNTWGLSVSVPLFASHAHEGEILRAHAERDQAIDQLARTRALALAEVRRAAADLAANRERLKALETLLLPEAERVAAAAEFAYRKGAIGLLDVLDARRTLRQTQIDSLTARAESAKAADAMRLQFAASANP